MNGKIISTWAMAVTTMMVGLTSCGIDMPKEVKTSYETTIETTLYQTCLCHHRYGDTTPLYAYR